MCPKSFGFGKIKLLGESSIGSSGVKSVTIIAQPYAFHVISSPTQTMRFGKGILSKHNITLGHTPLVMPYSSTGSLYSYSHINSHRTWLNPPAVVSQRSLIHATGPLHKGFAKLSCYRIRVNHHRSSLSTGSVR